MPRIDDIEVQSKVFKKKEYRSWDGNLLEKLRLIPNQSQDKSSNTATQPTDEAQLGLNKSSIEASLESNHRSAEVQSELTESSTKVHIEFQQGSLRVQNKSSTSAQIELISNATIAKTLISKLSGIEHKIFFFVINICSVKGTLSTGNINGEELNHIIGTTKNGRETSLKRLVKKGLIKREQGKTGLNGTLNLYINELLKAEALSYLNFHNAEKELMAHWGSLKAHDQGSNGAHLGLNNLAYSSSNINKTTTNESNLNSDWMNIDIEPLRDLGFSETQLSQLQNKNNPEIVQESIYHFAYGLKHNPKFKSYSEPLNVIMGVLRKGQAWFEKDYQSPQEIAMQQLIERKKSQQDREKALMEELEKLEFEEWLSKLPIEEKTRISSGFIIPTEIKNSKEVVIRAKFFEFFKKNVYSKNIN